MRYRQIKNICKLIEEKPVTVSRGKQSKALLERCDPEVRRLTLKGAATFTVRNSTPPLYPRWNASPLQTGQDEIRRE